MSAAAPARRRTPKAAATPFAMAYEAMTEHEHQVKLFQWADRLTWLDARLAMLHAIPNGGLRDIRVAKKLKAEGQKKGYPDTGLDVARQLDDGTWHHSLRIELKRMKGGAVSPEQRQWHKWLRAQGVRVEVCKGWLAAARVIAEHLGLPPDTVPAS